MSVYQLRMKALEEWSSSKELQREYTTPEFYWWKKYQRIYCPKQRADFSSLTKKKTGTFGF